MLLSHKLRVPFTMVREAGQQAMTAHIMSPARKQRKMDVGNRLPVSIFN